MNLRKLIEAIGTAWDAGEIGVPLHFGTMPERAALPAATMNVISNIPTGAGMSAVPEGVLVQFSVYSDSESVGECIDIRDKLRAAFDNVTLTISGATLVRGDWVNEVGPVSDPDEGWDCHIDYRFVIQSV
jgi:hypothetical protein